MKVLTFSSESDFEKNEHEIAKLSKHQHRNVVGFVEAIEGDNVHYVVLELCSHSLHDELCENQKLGVQMDVVRVYRVTRDVLDGIGFLHSRGEIYGDLKGPNVLIGKDGIAKLGDFGGVVGTGTMKTSNSAECGTMQFWAPEFFKLAGKTGKTGSSIGSFAGDMWAFGQLLLEMLTSRSWIVGGSSVEIEKSVLGFDIGSICSSEGIVGEVQILLSLLLNKNPSQRISSAELVRTNLLLSVLGPETPLSRFFAEELEEMTEEVSPLAQEFETLLQDYRHLQAMWTKFETTDKVQIDALEKELHCERRERAKEHEALMQEHNEHKKTQQLLHKQEQARQADKNQMQALEYELSAAQEEIRRLKEATQNHRSEPQSLQPSPSANSSLVFTDPSHFHVKIKEITRTGVGRNQRGHAARMYFGLMDSRQPLPTIDETLGYDVKHSVGLNRYSDLIFNTPSSRSNAHCHSWLKEGDCVRMEVDLDSTSRTVQFFVNGKAVKDYVSGLPSSVRIGV
ncbi:putative Protein kinase domain containing protein [Blattamonas nauphoetae]|uniref:Protein kinase domain-containing protein n=1 Tax=Blattamonas nauphoetae TaxID=2049346 RepID=A0ABQ9XBT5_9EUKA|nr:putative Protein kinase domain containing protein [Blattamonas nauphoetae]